MLSFHLFYIFLYIFIFIFFFSSILALSVTFERKLGQLGIFADLGYIVNQFITECIFYSVEINKNRRFSFVNFGILKVYDLSTL